ncbi:MAG: hypothetical protein VW378_00155 [bacterium]
MRKTIFLFVLFVCIGLSFFVLDYNAVFYSEAQRIKTQYEQHLTSKVTDILNTFLPSSTYRVVVSVSLDMEEYNVEKIVNRPHKIRVVDGVDIVNNRVPVDIVVPDVIKNRDLSMPGFSKLMPDKDSYIDIYQSRKNMVLPETKVVSNEKRFNEKFLVDTETSRRVISKYKPLYQHVFVLLSEDSSTIISDEKLQTLLMNGLGVRDVKENRLIIQRFRFRLHSKWYKKLWDFAHQYKTYVFVILAVLGAMVLLNMVYRVLLAYFKRPKVEQKDDVKPEPQLSPEVTLEDKKQQLLEFAKSDPDKVKELLDIWMK